MDPLLLLRETLSSDAGITLLSITDDLTTEVTSLSLATHISFPPSSFSSTPVILPKDTPTRYLSDNLPTSTLTFDLQSLVFAYLKRDAAVVEYMTGVREIGMGFVSIIERKVVVDWLIGKSGLEGPKGRIIPLEEDSHEKEKDETMDAKESVEEGQVLDTVIEKEREVPVAKRAKYFIDKEDQDRVRQILRVVDGPSYATQGPDNRPIKDAVGYKTRATILRGERLNVSLIRPQVSQVFG
jgi:parafibromin